MLSANSTQIRWHSLDSAQRLQNAVFETIIECAKQSICARGQFHIVLAGGNTPREIYNECPGIQTDWSVWHVYFGDERCLATTDPSRNSYMAREAWLDKVAIPESQIHTIPAELGPEAATRQYRSMLENLPEFDLVLLGLGEDGHTASLFPAQDWGGGTTSADVLPVFGAPKPPAERVSLSANRLSQTRKLVFMVTGEAKLPALAAWRSGQKIPAGAISPNCGVDVFCESSLLMALDKKGQE